MLENGPTPTENGVPQGTEISTGVKPGKTNLHLHSDGTPITIWLDELVEIELRFATLEDLLVLELDNDDTAELRLEVELELLELIDDFGELELTTLLNELITGTAEETTVALELDGAIELEEAGTNELDEIAKEEAGKLTEEELTANELGATELELKTDEVGTKELEDKTTLEEATGVADETGAIVELDEVELADTGKLLIKLETTELGATEDKLEKIALEILELELLELIMLGILLEVKELSKLERLELIEDRLELNALVLESTELLETFDKLDRLELDNKFDELTTLEEFKLLTLETEEIEELGTTDEVLINDELLEDEEVGVALNTTFNGLLQGIVKSKLMAKKLYCTLHVRPSPDVKV